jgi:predicted chitinase
VLTAASFERVGVPRALARAHIVAATRAMREADIVTWRECVDFLAQCFHECGALRFMEEIASGAAYEGRCSDLGNCHPGDGVRYKGRGVMQLTGRANYRSAGAALNLPLEEQPWLAAKPVNAWRIAALYWRRRVHPKGTPYPDFETITRRINGGTNGWADRLEWRRRFSRRGVGVIPRAEAKDCRFYRRSLKHWQGVANKPPRHTRKRARAMVKRRRQQLKRC